MLLYYYDDVAHKYLVLVLLQYSACRSEINTDIHRKHTIITNYYSVCGTMGMAVYMPLLTANCRLDIIGE